MTKDDLVKKIHGESLRAGSFYYDCALPQPLLNKMAKYLSENPTSSYREAQPKPDDQDENFNKFYGIIVGGSVYAYCKDSGYSGILPLTPEAFNAVWMYNAALLFVPTIRIKGDESVQR